MDNDKYLVEELQALRENMKAKFEAAGLNQYLLHREYNLLLNKCVVRKVETIVRDLSW